MLKQFNSNQKSSSPQLKVKTRLKAGAQGEGIVNCLMDAESLRLRGYLAEAEDKLIQCQNLAQNLRF